MLCALLLRLKPLALLFRLAAATDSVLRRKIDLSPPLLLLPLLPAAPAPPAADAPESPKSQDMETAMRSCCSFPFAVLLPVLGAPSVLLDRLVAEAECLRILRLLSTDEVSGSRISKTWGSAARVMEDAAQLTRLGLGATLPGVTGPEAPPAVPVAAAARAGAELEPLPLPLLLPRPPAAAAAAAPPGADIKDGAAEFADNCRIAGTL